ncbi:MAG: DUF3294 domain-containing protein [Candidatus Sericytochromatia bacterium]|nr:DUF3294 domain-containing protein [Candidatus Sericytochromatia bacterium]
MTTATETRPSLAAEMLDAWLASYKSAVWSQEQLEQLTAGWISQTRTMRQDGQKVMEILVSQAKGQADEMTRLSEASLQRVMAQVPAWDALTAADLRRQVAELNQRVEALSADKA